MKKYLLAGSVLAAVLFAGKDSIGQTGGLYKNTLKVGVSGGVAVPNNNVGGTVGLDLNYQYLVTNHFGVGVASGYQHYFGKENKLGSTTIDNNSAGVIPVAALLRYYPKAAGIYAGADLGYGFVVGDDRVAEGINVSRPDGGFYIRPQVGYHNRNWNFFVHYSKLFTPSDHNITLNNEVQKYNLGNIGVGVQYNIGLGYK
ncbi:hypothetical protein ACFS6H_16770 [Terrimonas rubra]|uniref:Outer membrane protein beta-barrel domain-containing protein n=1 Tax=Terrimonas rubra TaxID=1035890 RepID=A0ABW6A7Z7_9BACT